MTTGDMVAHAAVVSGMQAAGAGRGAQTHRRHAPSPAAARQMSPGEREALLRAVRENLAATVVGVLEPSSR